MDIDIFSPAHIRFLNSLYNRFYGYYGRPQINGQRYFGRGFIQLTGPDAYRDFSTYMYHNDRIYNNPDLILHDANLSINAALWFVTVFKVRVHLESEITNGNWRRTRFLTNGGYNDWDAYHAIITALSR